MPPEEEDLVFIPSQIARSAFELATGQIRFYSVGAEGTILFPELPDLGWVDGQWDGATHYALDGEAVPRPVTGLPAIHSIAAGIDWPIADVPAGTTVLINGEQVGTVDATGLTLSFALAGIWRVDLRPPFPWIEASCEVAVT